MFCSCFVNIVYITSFVLNFGTFVVHHLMFICEMVMILFMFRFEIFGSYFLVLKGS